MLTCSGAYVLSADVRSRYHLLYSLCFLIVWIGRIYTSAQYMLIMGRVLAS